MSEINVPLLRKAVQWAEAEYRKGEESKWNQASWACISEASCGTSYCIAGHVAVDAGWEFDKFISSTDANGAVATMGMTRDGVRDDVENIAARELGLNEYEAGALFAAYNSIEQVRGIAEDIAGEKL